MGTPWSWSLPAAAPAAAEARDVVRRRCSVLPAPVLDDVLLLVTELVANAVRHGRGPVTLTLVPREDGVRVEVTDASPTRPRPRDKGLEAESGRGLHIVDALASRWGSMPRETTGKTVWFELDIHRGDTGRLAWPIAADEYRSH